MKINVAPFLLPFYLLISTFLSAQSTSQLETVIQGLRQDPGLETAHWGFCVKEVQSGKVLASYNPNQSLVTASAMKAITTSTALLKMGEAYRYETVLGYRGKLNTGGVLEGDLIVKGTGDPTLGSDRFDAFPNSEQLIKTWGDAVLQRGIRIIEGNLIADAAHFSSQSTPGNWSWEDMGNYYGAGSWGINFHENLYYLDFKSGPTPGSATQILRTRPLVSDLSFTNEVKAGPRGSGDNAYIFGAPYSQERYVRGTIPPARNVFTIKGSLPNPPMFLLTEFREYLRKCGITVKGKLSVAFSSTPGTITTLHTHHSPSLAEIARETNYESINLYAESLLKSIAVQSGEKGTTDAGIDALISYWKSRGLDTKGMLLRDGSGLSPNNAVTPLQLAEILRLSYLGPSGRALYNSLPVAGISGTIKSMLKGTTAQGKIHMKSGYISHVRSYTGFVESRSGKTLVFAMMSNNYTCTSGRMRRLFERLMLAMERY
ncbi:MAG: D-alanyl-D-alanine carboxypeptidase/D-alanyl-D-alanine-endopeptidase [Bacteroidota bacterium]